MKPLILFLASFLFMACSSPPYQHPAAKDIPWSRQTGKESGPQPSTYSIQGSVR